MRQALRQRLSLQVLTGSHAPCYNTCGGGDVVNGKGGVGGKRVVPVTPKPKLKSKIQDKQLGLDFGPLAEADHTPLRRYLGQQGLTIGQLADGCQVSKAYMNRLVNGRRDPSLHMASRLAAFLGVPIETVCEMVKTKARSYKVGGGR